MDNQERNVFERVGYGGGDEDEAETTILTDGTGNIMRMQKHLLKMELTDEDYFMFRLKEDLKQFDSKFYKRFDMSFVRKSIKNVSHLIYKNPLAYALGYYCASNGEIDQDRMAECYSLCIVNKKPIKRSDILRYARLVLSNQ